MWSSKTGVRTLRAAMGHGRREHSNPAEWAAQPSWRALSADTMPCRARLAHSVSGGVRIGQGREAEILEHGDDRVLRLLWDADREPWLDREDVALRAGSAAGAPVPAAYERMIVDGRPGLVMDGSTDRICSRGSARGRGPCFRQAACSAGSTCASTRCSLLARCRR